MFMMKTLLLWAMQVGVRFMDSQDHVTFGILVVSNISLWNEDTRDASCEQGC